MPTKLRPDHEYVYSVVNMCDLLCEKVHLQPYSKKNEFID